MKKTADELEKLIYTAYWDFIRDRTKFQGNGMSERDAFERSVRAALIALQEEHGKEVAIEPHDDDPRTV